MYINFNILRFYSYFTVGISFLKKINALELEFASRSFNAKRDGLVTGSTFNEVWFEGCNEMKKVPSCHKGRSKLSESQNRVLGLTQVNFYFYTGSTLPQRGDDMLRVCIFSFSDPGFRREDSGLSIYTCTKKILILLCGFAFFFDPGLHYNQMREPRKIL